MGEAAKNPQENPFNGAPLIPGNPGNSGGKPGRSGRRPDWLKKVMAKGRAKAVVTLRKRMKEDKLDSDQLLKLVKDWAPPDEQVSPTLIVKFVRE